MTRDQGNAQAKRHYKIDIYPHDRTVCEFKVRGDLNTPYERTVATFEKEEDARAFIWFKESRFAWPSKDGESR